MFTLLQVLQPEFEGLAGADTEDEDELSSTDLNQISVVARRVLPGARHYSSWLTSNTAILINQQTRDTPLSVQIKELWKIYASTLTLLASTFPVSALTAIDYLLEEDEDTLGFKPFENERAQGRYYQPGLATKKPKWHNKGVERQHPNLEMFGRIRDFLAEGLALAVDPVCIFLFFFWIGLIDFSDSPNRPCSRNDNLRLSRGGHAVRKSSKSSGPSSETIVQHNRNTGSVPRIPFT